MAVGDGTGAACRRRADAIAMNMWPSRGLVVRVFEIKVSRNDLALELKDPTKAEAFAHYCNTVYLTVPTGLTKGLDIPHTWGIIEVSDGGRCRIKREATINDNPTPLTPSFVAGLVRAASKTQEGEINAAIRVAIETIREEEQARRKQDVEREL